MRILLKQVGRLFFILIAVIYSFQAGAAESDFPVPDNIRPAVAFWVKVYTQINTKTGFLHDSQNLDIIYNVLLRDRSKIKISREQIENDLKLLATGKREALTSSQRRILGLWPDDVTNARLAIAAENVRWQLGQSDRFMGGLKRSGAYRPHINEVLKAKGLPVELGALPHVESSFTPGAYSNAAATGMWQFVRSTATRFMEVNYVVDERLDPYIATYGALELLEFNYNALGNWPLALTAYNHGANGMARAVREVGSDDIGVIIEQYKGPRFGFASRNFYPQFIAVQEVEQRAEEFFGTLQMDPYPDFDKTELPAYVAAEVLADKMGVSLNSLKRDNPALQAAVWSGTKRMPAGYEVKINRANFSGDLLSSVNAISPSQLFRQQMPDLSYTISRGDSLSEIAQRYSTSVSELMVINQLENRHRIRIGQTILLPQTGSIPTLLVNNSFEIPGSGFYEIESGDTLSTIAQRFRLPQETLFMLNNLTAQSIILPGQTLNLRSTQTIAAANLAGIAEQEFSQNISASLFNFLVDEDNFIEVQEAETLGHYAGWLDILPIEIRNLNGLSKSQPLLVGTRLKLDFSRVNSSNFETQRRQFQRDFQTRYFANWRIQNTEEYSIKNRDSLASLTQSRSVPMWLFHQYNPGVDADRLQIGQIIIFPVVVRVL